MCEGCEAAAWPERILDYLVETQLPAMIARPLDTAVLYGNKAN